MASIGMIAVCVPIGWDATDSFKGANVVDWQTCALGTSGAVQAILASPAELDTSRFEFRMPVDADATAERVSPGTRIEPTVEKSPPTSASQTAPLVSAVPLATLRVSAPHVTELSVAGIRALQSELKRHGCYPGRIDGDWGPASRYAAARFTSAMNAALPVDKPEPALLALARRHNGACTEIFQSSRIVTASTIPITGAVVSSGGTAFKNSRASREPTNWTERPKPSYGWDAPRIVRANGMLATGSNLAPVFQGENNVERRMALGAEPQSPNVAPPAKPRTRRATARNTTYTRRVTARAPRARRRSRGRYQTARRSRKSWERRILQTLNLSAQ